jgi:gamma-glutamyl-gamma-aminobutyrate hydrolase PuuD
VIGVGEAPLQEHFEAQRVLVEQKAIHVVLLEGIPILQLCEGAVEEVLNV